MAINWLLAAMMGTFPSGMSAIQPEQPNYPSFPPTELFTVLRLTPKVAKYWQLHLPKIMALTFGIQAIQSIQSCLPLY